MPRTSRTQSALLALAGGLTLLSVPTAASSHSQVVRGELTEFAVGLAEGQDIAGHAQLVRRADETTFVTLHAEGLKPGAAYLSHVHHLPCDTGAAGGHYMHDRDGDVDPVNEIWPGGHGFTATAAGTATVDATNDFWAGEDAVSVVIHEVRPASGTTPKNPKVACADLS